MDTRYNRQENMPEWGSARQSLIRAGSVACIGAGGVKATLLMALVAAGIGKLRIIEPDMVELSNLNRQLLFRTPDIGKKKGRAALETLQLLNPEVQIEWVDEKVDPFNIADLLMGFDFIVEGGESPAGRNLVNEYCLQSKQPFVHASAQFNYGYVFSVIPMEKTSCFACFFPHDHTRIAHTGAVPVSVLSTSIAGSLGANEVLKWLSGHRSKMISNRRLCFSSLFLSQEFIYEAPAVRTDQCPICSKY
jgi:molybdopterin/thiamine biosynthesis adenylyltransferase